MSKFPPKPNAGQLWQGEICKPIYKTAPVLFELGRWKGRPHAKDSYFEYNDVCRWIIDYSIDLKTIVY